MDELAFAKVSLKKRGTELEYALWNGKLLTASEVGVEYEYEKKIRKASADKELVCQDSTCKNKRIKYCHGNIKAPYFAHVENSECDYAQYEKARSEEILELCEKIKSILELKCFEVKKEMKMLPHHYSHLVIYDDETPSLAIEIIKKSFNVKKADALTEEYKNAGLNVSWIEIGNVDEFVSEQDTFFAQRFSLNESNKILFIVDKDLDRVCLYKMDIKEYVYKGKRLIPYHQLFSMEATIEEIIYENGMLIIENFEKSYQDWMSNRETRFMNLCNIADENEKRVVMKWKEQEQRKELEKRQKIEQEEQRKISEEKKTQDLRNEHIELGKSMTGELPIVYDSTGKRIIKCKVCGAVGYDNLFGEYGGNGSINLGICYECGKNETINNPVEYKNDNDLFKQNKENKWKGKVLCPDCGKEMVKRKGRNGEFYGCTNFPNCRGTRSIKKGTILGFI